MDWARGLPDEVLVIHRKATVIAFVAQKLGLQYADSRLGGMPVPRPFLVGLKASFHYAPSQGDQVLVHHADYGGAYPTAATSCTDTPQNLYALNSGESVILHADGRAFGYLHSDGSTTGCIVARDRSSRRRRFRVVGQGRGSRGV